MLGLVPYMDSGIHLGPSMQYCHKTCLYNALHITQITILSKHIYYKICSSSPVCFVAKSVAPSF